MKALCDFRKASNTRRIRVDIVYDVVYEKFLVFDLVVLENKRVIFTETQKADENLNNISLNILKITLLFIGNFR